MQAESNQHHSAPTGEGDGPVRRDDLASVFVTAEKPEANFRIGAEEEKFGCLVPEGQPVSFAGNRSVAQVLRLLAERHDWREISEGADAPVIALERAHENITLEPGAQLELSGAPLSDLHQTFDEKRRHLAELLPISEELGLSWHAVGFHPTARLSDLPWVPKTRYPVMRAYLPGQGDGALNMMQRTATVQANYDFSSEEDAMRKLRVALRLSPFIHAMLANAPFAEGKDTGKKSVRGDVWLRMDKHRSGLIPALWRRPTAGYEDYIEWSLDAGMFLFWREGRPIKNTGQTFRDFLAWGYEGHRATLADFRLHLGTLFPEVRLKNTLEVRPCDAQATDLSLAALAVWTGILYGSNALEQADALSEGFSYEEVAASRPALVARGLEAPFQGATSSWALGERILALAHSGLGERGRGEDVYLAPLRELVVSRRCPADLLLGRVHAGESPLSATRITQP